jgi:hypothetical protein
MMTKDTLLKNIRRTVIVQFIISALVLSFCWLIGWFYLYTIGMAFTWVGVFIWLFSSVIFFGGNMGISDDLRDFSRTGAGKIRYHINTLLEAREGRPNFILFGLANGFVPVFIGYLLQTLGQ